VKALAVAGLRVDTDPAAESVKHRIRRAKLEKLPYVLVVGDADVASRTVGVNGRGDAPPERGVPLDEFVAQAKAEAAPPQRGESG